ncbi:hypothetical protein EON80_19565 [bacterium]|nr:MAG: hypothetical protein EON80_19565 [bacterium]
MDNKDSQQYTDVPAQEGETPSHSHGALGHVHGPNCSHGHHHDPIVRADPKVGRNDACPCGSGQKFKKCHGK